MQFIPITSIYGIPSSSFGLQLGTTKKFLAIQIYLGKKILNLKTFKGIYPFDANASELTRYVKNQLFIPSISVSKIDRIIRILISELNKKLEGKNNYNKGESK